MGRILTFRSSFWVEFLHLDRVSSFGWIFHIWIEFRSIIVRILIFWAGNCQGRRRNDPVLCLLQSELWPSLDWICIVCNTMSFGNSLPDYFIIIVQWEDSNVFWKRCKCTHSSSHFTFLTDDSSVGDATKVRFIFPWELQIRWLNTLLRNLQFDYWQQNSTIFESRICRVVGDVIILYLKVSPGSSMMYRITHFLHGLSRIILCYMRWNVAKQ